MSEAVALPAPEEAPPARKTTTAAWTSTTYFAEGLPFSILHQLSAEFLTGIGLSPETVGHTAGLHLTHTLKFVWSPIVEAFGTLRSWMVGMQALLGIAVGLLAVLAHRMALLPDPMRADTTLLWLALIAVGVLSATHDIACDGYYMEALGEKDQALYSGLRVAAFRVAMFVGSSALVFLGGAVNWLLGFGAGAAILGGLALAHGALLPRPAEAADGATPQPRLDKVWDAYASFLTQERAALVIVFVLCYKLGDVLMFSMSKVLLRDLGVDTATRGVLNLFGTPAGILGAMVGGAWISRRTLARTLTPLTLAMALPIPLYVWLAWASPHLFVIGTVLVVEQFCAGLGAAALVVYIMRRCNPEHRASHYAFATALTAVTQMATGYFSGHLYEAVGPVAYFTIASLASAPALLLLPFVPR